MDHDRAKYKLVSLLSSMDLPERGSYDIASASDLLVALADGCTTRGHYWADPRLVRRLFWWQDTPPGVVAGWIDELLGAKDVAIRPLGMNCYSPGVPVMILTVLKKHRFPRFANRPAIPEALRIRVYERDGYMCVRCKTTQNLSLDHIHPYSQGGEDTEENLQTMCRPCNSSKGARVHAH